jgi:uncharacterized protein with NRDE domain
MCTVTYIPTKEYIFITSNRDEKNWRADALAPAKYKFSSGTLLFPKDGDAGGTWIAVHENGNVVVFLNGALRAHTPLPPYQKSRGLVLLDILNHGMPYQYFLEADLDNIEPFTAVIRDRGSLYECRWDGSHKHHREVSANEPHIWSSATLYDDSTISKRKSWFDKWIAQKDSFTQDDIIHFHQFTGDGDTNNDLLMNRGSVFTVSITSLVIGNNELHMQYRDLRNKKKYNSHLAPEQIINGR